MSAPAPAARAPRPEPRARLRLPLSDLLELFGALGDRIDQMDPATLTDENPAYRLYRRLGTVVVSLANSSTD